jgi:hypothetical protein
MIKSSLKHDAHFVKLSIHEAQDDLQKSQTPLIKVFPEEQEVQLVAEISHSLHEELQEVQIPFEFPYFPGKHFVQKVGLPAQPTQDWSH